MWLGHFIEHLMCIGGELEHHKSSPTAGQKNRAVHCSARGQGVYIGQPLVPVCGWNRDYRTPFGPGSSHKPGSMVVGQERGALVPVRVWNRDQRGQTNRDQWPTRPGRRPGLTNRDRCPHRSRFVSEPGLMGFSGLDRSPVFY